MEPDAGGEVKVADAVPGEDDAVLPRQKVPAGPNCPRRAQRGLLGEIGQRHAPGAAVPEVVGDCLGEIPQGDGGLVDAVAAQQQEQMLQHRPAEEGNHGLGQLGGQGPQAGALPAGQKDRFHGKPFLCARMGLVWADWKGLIHGEEKEKGITAPKDHLLGIAWETASIPNLFNKACVFMGNSVK